MSRNIQSLFAGALPEFARMPKSGRCPYTGLTRSTLEKLERVGLIRLIRIVQPGLRRGVVMIPVAEVLDFIRQQGRNERIAK